MNLLLKKRSYFLQNSVNKKFNSSFRELEFVIKYHRRRSKKQLENRGLYQNCNKCMFECNCKSAGGDGQVHFIHIYAHL